MKPYKVKLVCTIVAFVIIGLYYGKILLSMD